MPFSLQVSNYLASESFTIRALSTRATCPTPSFTFSRSCSLTLLNNRPSNLSGWNRNIVSLSLSFRSFLSASPSSWPFDFDARCPGSKNVDIAVSVKSSTKTGTSRDFLLLVLLALGWAGMIGQGTSSNPRSVVPSTSRLVRSFHRLSYSSRATSQGLFSLSRFLRCRSSSASCASRAVSALTASSCARRASLRACL